MGRTWERAAYIKARPCAGDLAAGEKFLEALRPFVWRKHLDFAAIQDAHDMRLRIREHKGLGGAMTLPGHNMKLGRGGIREIEFFTQTRQMIAGGRDPDLRVRGTVEGLAALADKGWVPPDVADVLTEHYRATARSSTGCRWSATRRPMTCRRVGGSSTGWRPSWGRRQGRSDPSCWSGCTRFTG